MLYLETTSGFQERKKLFYENSCETISETKRGFRSSKDNFLRSKEHFRSTINEFRFE